MFSRNRVKFLFSSLVAVMILLSACTPEIGEKPPDGEGLQLSSTQCLSEAANHLKLFFEAEATNAQLSSAWGCVELAFVQFDKYVRGRDKDRYTSQEIVDFLEKNFFSNLDLEKRKITPELQRELMKVKRIFIGGSADFVTRDELKKSPEVFRRLNRLTQELNPFMNIIVMNWQPNLNSNRPDDIERFEKSNLAFQTFAKNLAELIKTQKSDYHLNDAIKLIREFEKFFDEDWDWVEDIEKLLPGVKKLKITLAGGDEDHITNEEWSPVLILGARGYFQYLRYYYFIRNAHQTGSGIGLVYVTQTLEDVFSIFQDLLAYKKAGFISRQEIYELLKAFEGVWEDLRVSESLILELMKIKKLLVGGTVEVWTVTDFEQARLSVPLYRKVVERFLPYLNIYAFDWNPENYSPEKAREILKDSAERLESVAKEFADLLKSSYSYQEFLSVLREIEHLHPKPDGTSLYKDLARYESLFTESNHLLYKREDTVILQENWKTLLPLVARFYSIFQYYDYFMKDKGIRQTQTILDLGTVIDDVILFADKLFELKKEGHFTHTELVRLSLAFSAADILPQSIQVSTYKSILTALLQHLFFDPARRLAGEKNQILAKEQFQRLKHEFHNWKATQVVLNRLFKDNSETTYAPNELLKAIKDLIVQNQRNIEITQGLSEVYNLLQADVSQTLDSEDQLQISNKTQWSYKINAGFQANLSRTLARLLIQSFSTEKSLKRITKCDAQVAFGLADGILNDLNIFDLGPGFIDSRFLEANIFMIRGNGDNYLDHNELSEMTTVIFSGLRVHASLEKSARNQCKVFKDSKGKEFVTYKCLSEHHYVAVRKYMRQMPDFVTYVEKMAANDVAAHAEDEFTDVATRAGFNDWNQVFRETLKATGWKPNKGYGSIKEESVYFGDAVYYPFIIHYMELLYAKFDTSRVDGIIQSVEARKAFPTFKPLLKDLAKDQLNSGMIKESDLLAVFTFILKYEEEPGFSNLIRWLRWKAKPSKWDVWVHRSQLARILGFIADKASSSSGSIGGGGNACKGSAAGGRQQQVPPVQPDSGQESQDGSGIGDGDFDGQWPIDDEQGDFDPIDEGDQ